MMSEIYIRFDGPPEHEAGRFVEVERDGKGISFGEWRQDGEYWLLVLTEVNELLDALRDIAEGKGAFKRDRLAHAESVIENLTTIAKQAIAKATPE